MGHGEFPALVDGFRRLFAMQQKETKEKVKK
jgi:hypothetical protein